MGIMGMGIYILFNTLVYFTKEIGFNHTNDLLAASKFGVLTTMVCQIIACPDLDLCTYWIWLYIFSLVIRIMSQNVRDSRDGTQQLLPESLINSANNK